MTTRPNSLLEKKRKMKRKWKGRMIRLGAEDTGYDHEAGSGVEAEEGELEAETGITIKRRVEIRI